MDQLDALYNLSEVAITLAGFIAIATVLQARDKTTIAAMRVRVVNLLIASFGILLLAQCTIAILQAGIPQGTAWQISSGLWILVTVSASTYNLRNHNTMREAGMGLPTLLNWSQWSLLAGVAVLQVVNIVTLQAFWPFLVAMIMILVVAGISFTIIVLQSLKERGQ